MARIELEEQAEGRRPIDAGWSDGKRRAVIGAAVAAGALAIGVGWWLSMQNRVTGLPRTPEQAVALMRSPRFDRLDPSRRSQILAETSRMLGSMSAEQVEALGWSDEDWSALKGAAFDEYARKVARGEVTGWEGKGKGADEGDGKGKGGEPSAEDGGDDSEADVAAEMAAWVTDWRASRQSGNAQDAALRGEVYGGVGER